MVSCISYQGEFTKRTRAWNRICRLYLVLTSIRYENLAWSLALGLRNLEPKGPFNLPILKSYLAFWVPNWAYQVFWCMHHSIIWQQIWVWVDSSRVRPVRARVGESEKAGTTSGIRLIRNPLLCHGQQPPKYTFCCFPLCHSVNSLMLL